MSGASSSSTPTQLKQEKKPFNIYLYWDSTAVMFGQVSKLVTDFMSAQIFHFLWQDCSCKPSINMIYSTLFSQQDVINCTMMSQFTVSSYLSNWNKSGKTTCKMNRLSKQWIFLISTAKWHKKKKYPEKLFWLKQEKKTLDFWCRNMNRNSSVKENTGLKCKTRSSLEQQRCLNFATDREKTPQRSLTLIPAGPQRKASD